MKYYKETDYEISKDGDVYRKGHKLKPYTCKNGYQKIVGSKEGTRVHIWVHQAVAELYVPNYDDGLEVLHLNGNKTDNRSINLIWTTRKHICNYMTKILGINIGEDKGAAKLTNDNIKYIRETYIPRHPEYGARALSRTFGVSATAISLVVRNKTWTHIK